VNICATRGHLLPDPPDPGDDPFTSCRSGDFGLPCPEVKVQLFAWKAGGTPVIGSNDNWSRTPTFHSSPLPFTDWANNGNNAGEWACQLFTFHYDKPPVATYVALSISGLNHRDATYVAFDCVPGP
jgi:hypothetical protein